MKKQNYAYFSNKMNVEKILNIIILINLVMINEQVKWPALYPSSEELLASMTWRSPVCSMASGGTATCASPPSSKWLTTWLLRSMRQWKLCPKGNHHTTLGDVPDSPAALGTRLPKGSFGLGLKPGFSGPYLLHQSCWDMKFYENSHQTFLQ